MRSAAQLNAQALTGTLRMMHSCASASVNASLSDSLPLSSSLPAGPAVALSQSPGPGVRAVSLSRPEALG
eukprot:2795241-Amphidinium_carterae.1